MDENVYAPPNLERSAQELEAQQKLDENPVGIWRDGKTLVLNMDQAQFPPVCMMTCKPYDGSPSPVKISYVPNVAAWGAVLGVIGILLAQMISGKKRTLQLPIHDDWFQEKRRRNWIGGLWIALGLVLMIPGIIVGTALGNNLGDWVVIFSLSLLILPVSGVIYLLVWGKHPIAAKKMDNTYAWLKNVSNEYVQQFPQWPK